MITGFSCPYCGKHNDVELTDIYKKVTSISKQEKFNSECVECKREVEIVAVVDFAVVASVPLCDICKNDFIHDHNDIQSHRYRGKIICPGCNKNRKS